jgi:hypothetical protein
VSDEEIVNGFVAVTEATSQTLRAFSAAARSLQAVIDHRSIMSAAAEQADALSKLLETMAQIM